MDAPSFVAGAISLAFLRWAFREARWRLDELRERFRRPVAEPPARLYPSLRDPCLLAPKPRRRKAR